MLNGYSLLCTQKLLVRRPYEILGDNSPVLARLSQVEGSISIFDISIALEQFLMHSQY